MAERREGSVPVLFPLSERSIYMADASLRYVDNDFTEADRRDYIVDIFMKAPKTLRNFLDRKAQETPMHTLGHVLYRYGNTIALDSVYLERLNLKLPPIKVEISDIRDYESVRAAITGPNWYEETNGTLQRMAVKINGLVEHVEPAFGLKMSEVLESETPNTAVVVQMQRKIGFLLGIADAYFPLRFAVER